MERGVAEWKEIREEKWQRGTGDVVSWEVKEHYHKDNLRHLPRFPGFFVTFRILVTRLAPSCRAPSLSVHPHPPFRHEPEALRAEGEWEEWGAGVSDVLLNIILVTRPAQPSSAHHSPRHPTRPHLTPYTRVVILPPLVTLVRWMEWDERCDERMMTTRAGSHVSLRLVSAIWCLNRLVPSHLRPLSTSLLVHRPPLVTLRLTSSTSLVSSGGRREDTTDGRRRETSGERKWHAWAKGRRKWVKGGHFLGPVPPAGTAKGRDGTEEWRPVPHSSHYARRQAPASERSERSVHERNEEAGRSLSLSAGGVSVKGVRWGGRSLPSRVRLWDGGERDAVARDLRNPSTASLHSCVELESLSVSFPFSSLSDGVVRLVTSLRLRELLPSGTTRHSLLCHSPSTLRSLPAIGVRRGRVTRRDGKRRSAEWRGTRRDRGAQWKQKWCYGSSPVLSPFPHHIPLLSFRPEDAATREERKGDVVRWKEGTGKNWRRWD